MNFDLKDWMKKRELKVKAKQEELKRLPDNELMLLDNDLWASIAELRDEPSEAQHILHEAISKEVERRATAACWFWKRWLKPKECTKWLDHIEDTDIMAQCWAYKYLQNAEEHEKALLDAGLIEKLSNEGPDLEKETEET